MPQRVVVVFSAHWAFSIFELNIPFNIHDTTFASWHIFKCHNALWSFENSHNTTFRVMAVSLMPQRAVVVFSAQWAFSIFERYIYRFQNVFLRCPTTRLHYFLSSHWLSFRFLSFMAFFIPSTQFFFGLPRALFCFGIHFNAILDILPSVILWTWPYHVSWFCSISSSAEVKK